tara:strand:+ start:1158 stop:1997 length:840 start_codon:yes stop_codon:yes gene_type:complete
MQENSVENKDSNPNPNPNPAQNSKRKIKLFISTPCYDSMMTMQYTISLVNLIHVLRSHDIDFMIDFTGNESLIPRARNHSLAKFRSTDCTHLFFIDADIEFPCEAVFDILHYDKDVVCCAYPKKMYNWNRFMYSMRNSDSKETFDSRGLDFAYNAFLDTNQNVIKDKHYIKVHHASTGFMLIKRDIINVLWEKHKELEIVTDNISSKDETIVGLFCCMIKNKQYLSEDYSFCERVNDVDGEVWINVAQNLNHVGKHIFQSDIKNRNELVRTRQERMCYQ